MRLLNAGQSLVRLSAPALYWTLLRPFSSDKMLIAHWQCHHMIRCNDRAIQFLWQCHHAVVQGDSHTDVTDITLRWQSHSVPMRSSHAVAKHDILLGQFQQHGIIEEFVDTHVFTQTLQQHTSQHQSIQVCYKASVEAKMSTIIK